MIVYLIITKVIILDASKKYLGIFNFYFCGGEVEIDTTSYMKLGVKFMGPMLTMTLPVQHYLYKGYDSMVVLEWQCSHFHFFTTEQTLNFPEFIDWCACNYSSSERVIMDTTKSKVLFLVSLLIVRDTFVVLATFTQLSVEFNEESLI